MKPSIATMPGYQVNEYLLVINPHQELASRIYAVREEFGNKFQTDPAKWIRPYIALASFSQYEMMEERITNRINAIAMGQYPFKVELKDFGSFPAHTIYINVTTKVPLQELVKSIRHETQRLMKLDEENKPYFIMEPHITVGRKLKPWQYEKAWLEYSHKNFSARFIADSMLLLKRRAGESRYQVAARFVFQNLPVTTRQGELFAV